MNQFCQHCGNKLEDGARFCGYCGAVQPGQPPQNQPVAEPTPQSAAQPATEPVYAEYVQPQSTNEKPKKKKKWLIIGIAAGVVAVLAAVFFIFIMPLFGAKSTRLITFSRGGDDYYAAPALVKLNGDKAPDIVMSIDEEGVEKFASVIYSRAAMSNNVIYQIDSRYGREESFVRYDFTSKTSVKVSRWVSSDVVRSAPFNNPDDEYPDWVTGIYHLQIDGNYAYFTLIPNMEYAFKQGNIRGKMGRISLDGKKIEELSGINAADFAVDGGWIYYFDEGYQPSTDGMIGKRDPSVAGIYKIKPNGSGKTLLHSFKVTSDQESEYEAGYSLTLCGDMQMIGGKLYFLDYSAEGKGRLARMGKNGGDVEYLSSSAVAYYTIDMDRSIAYYGLCSDFKDGYTAYYSALNPEFACYDIGKHTEIRVPTVRMPMQAASYHKGYLYFLSSNFMGGGHGSKVGLRMNVNTKAYEWLVYHDESTDEWVRDPETGKPTHQHNEGARYLTWETAEAY